MNINEKQQIEQQEEDEEDEDDANDDVDDHQDPLLQDHIIQTDNNDEEEEQYSYDSQILLERLNEIDHTLKNSSRDTAIDRYFLIIIIIILIFFFFISSFLVERLNIIQTLGCVQDISLPPGSSPTQLLQSGRKVYTLNPKDKAFAYLLRPDVRVEKVLNLIEQVNYFIINIFFHFNEN